MDHNQKIIHRIQFHFDDPKGKNTGVILPFTPLEKLFPGFTVMRWDENNLPLDLNPYTRIQAKNASALSGYFRCWLLKKYGGVFLDTGAEILKYPGRFRDACVELQSTEEYALFLPLDNDGVPDARCLGARLGASPKLLDFVLDLYEKVFIGPLRYVIDRVSPQEMLNLYFMEQEDTERGTRSQPQQVFFPNRAAPFFITGGIKLYPPGWFW